VLAYPLPSSLLDSFLFGLLASVEFAFFELFGVFEFSETGVVWPLASGVSSETETLGFLLLWFTGVDGGVVSGASGTFSESTDFLLRTSLLGVVLLVVGVAVLSMLAGGAGVGVVGLVDFFPCFDFPSAVEGSAVGVVGAGEGVDSSAPFLEGVVALLDDVAGAALWWWASASVFPFFLSVVVAAAVAGVLRGAGVEGVGVAVW